MKVVNRLRLLLSVVVVVLKLSNYESIATSGKPINYGDLKYSLESIRNEITFHNYTLDIYCMASVCTACSTMHIGTPLV